MLSPSVLNLKWPGSIMPAWTGPTGISETPSPSTFRNSYARSVDLATFVSISKSFLKGWTSPGHCSWSTRGLTSGCPSGTRPNMSLTSRS